MNLSQETDRSSYQATCQSTGDGVDSLVDGMSRKLSLTENRENRSAVSNQNPPNNEKSAKTKNTQVKKFCLKDFEIGRPLGKGKFGNVYLARTKKEKKLVALKVLFKQEIEAHNLMEQLKREIEIHHRLKHNNVVKLYSYFHDHKRVYLVLEYVSGGELFTAMKKSENGRFDEARASCVIRQLTCALYQCHKLRVVHRDIKPENILIGKNGEIKLADFGWSVAREEMKRQTLCGTLDYLPPEMVLSREYDERVDIWMTGVLMYEMLAGTAPFATPSPAQTYDKVENVDYKMPSHISDDAKDLLRLLLVKDPSKRLYPIKKMFYHPWITKYAPEEEKVRLAERNAGNGNSFKSINK